MGSGKTLAGIAECITLSLEYDGNFGLIGRATYPELRDSTWKELLDFPVVVDGQDVRFIDSPLVKSYNKANHEITLCNNSVIIGRALADGAEKLGKGLNLGWFYVDEMTEIPEEVFMKIAMGRLRLKPKCKTCRRFPRHGEINCPKCGKQMIRHTAFGTTNPEGHDWVWKKFVMQPTEDYFCVQASSLDNPHLPTEYVKQLGEMPDEWKKRYLYGSFDTFEGLVYKDFQDKAPHIITPFEIPDNWYRFIGLDHGYRNPTAVLWGAVDPKGNVFIYDEFYSSGKLVSEIAEIIKAKSGKQRIQQYLIDPSCRNRNGVTGRSVIDEFADYGLYFDGANNDVRAGINRVQEMMKIQPDGKPRLKIFNECRQLRTELQVYRWKEISVNAKQDSPEKPLKKGDHAVDALRYLANYIYDTPELKVKQKGFDYSTYLHREEEANWMAA
jgi:hypothetical protein